MTVSAPTQWICDTCGSLIQSPEDGFVELILDDDSKIVGATVVHRLVKSPYKDSKPSKGCYFGTGVDYELAHLVGPDGLSLLLNFLAPNEHGKRQVLQELHPNHVSEWVTLIRRLHIPHYDESRSAVTQAISRSGGEVNGNDPYLYTQRFMESYRKDFDDRE